MAIQTGLEQLAAEGARRLQGLRVGLVTHPAGCLPTGGHGIELLRQCGVWLTALFGPEHGVRGDVPAGKWVASRRDARSGLPAYSLYGPTKIPTAAMLRGLDVLVFDLQDIGCRSYTYLSTLGNVLEGGARHGIPILVLDRPNPLGLLRVEGGPVRPGFFSFVSQYPLAYRHGLTLGEAARLLVGEGWLTSPKRPDLSIVPCANLRRTDGWPAATHPWVPTSPNIPQAKTPLYYAATGIIGELEAVSIGVGTPRPFLVLGAPGIAAERLTAALPGTTVAAWTPSRGRFAGQRCQGVQLPELTIDQPLTRWNFALLAALREMGVPRLFPPGEATRLFDLSCGTDHIRKSFLRGASADTLWNLFQEGAAAFLSRRRPYLLYS